MKRTRPQAARLILLTLLLCALSGLTFPAWARPAGGGYGGSYSYVSFAANGGEGWMNGLDVYDETWNVPACGFTCQGRSFTGWGETPEGPAKYQPGDVAYNDGDMTLYALWGPMSGAEMAEYYAPVLYQLWETNVNTEDGVVYAEAELRFKSIDNLGDDSLLVFLRLGSADGPLLPGTQALTASDITRYSSNSYAYVSVPFLADGVEQVIEGGAVNGLLSGQPVFVTLARQVNGALCESKPVVFSVRKPADSPSNEHDDIDWFAASGNGVVIYDSDYSVTVGLLQDTVLPEGGLGIGNNTYHILTNGHTLSGALVTGWGEIFVEVPLENGSALAAYANDNTTLYFNGFGYNGAPQGSLTATLNSWGPFAYDSDYAVATVTNGTFLEDSYVTLAWEQDYGFANTSEPLRYGPADLDVDTLAAYTPKNVTVTPQEDGLIVECDYEPEARVININVDVYMEDGQPVRLISDSSSSSKDQVMSLEGDRQPFFVGVRRLSDEEEQEISENGAQKYVNGFKGGQRLSVTMNFEVGLRFQETPWSAPPVTFVYSSSAIGKTFAQGGGEVARNFLPDIATVTVTSPTEFTYTGDAQFLDYTVTLSDGTPLTLGVDYTEEYTGNWRPGEATLAVIGLGNYSGRITQPFTINGIDLASDDVTVTLAYTSTVFSGAPQSPEVFVANGDTVLRSSSDYYAEYTDNVGAGTATLTLTPGYNGLCSGTRVVHYTIEPRSMTSPVLRVALTQNRYAYTGEAFTPALSSVAWAGAELNEGMDYTVSYEDNAAVGTGYVVITGLGDYAGVRRVPFTIYQPVSLATSCTVDRIPPRTYTGAAMQPKVTVRAGGRILTEGWDYTLSYADNTAVGTATVTVTGRRDYCDSASANFTIYPADLSQCDMTLKKRDWPYGEAVYVYSGNENEPAATITFNGRQLYEGTDYTLSYVDNVDAGTATAVATGMGSFSGTLSASFVINPLDVNDLYFVSADSVTYNGQAQTTNLNLHYNSFDKLVEGVDYTVSNWTNNVNAGTASVTVTGQGNATGVRVVEFTINPAPVDVYRDYEVDYDRNVFYTGSPVTPNIQIKWKRDGRTLVEGADYAVEYIDYYGNDGNNHTDVQEGLQARITFQGNFSGSYSEVYFNIVNPGEALPYGTGGIYGNTEWTIDPEGTLTVLANGALADLSYHNDVAWRPYRDSIRKIVVGEGVTKLTAGAFEGCHFATEAVLPEGLTEISYSVFTDCESLKTINIPSTVTKLNAGTFTDVRGLEIHLPDNITRENLDGYFPAYERMKIFVKRGTVTEAALRDTGSAFYYEGYPDFRLYYNSSQGIVCTRYVGSSKDVRVPDFVEGLNGTFAGSNIVERVVIPASVRTMGYGNMVPFEYCYNLRELVIEPGDNLTELWSYFFYGCNNVTVYVPDNITTIGTILYSNDQNILFVANCDSYAIEWARSQMRWESHVWVEETERSSGPRYRLLHKNAVQHAGQAATCETAGWTDYVTCDACGYDNRQEIPAKGHLWSDVSYVWSGDYSQLTATRMCLNDPTHPETETVAAVGAEIPAICEAPGLITYVSDAFANPAFRAQAAGTETPALGHVWGEAAYAWNEDHSLLTATRACARDASHVETETVAVTRNETPAACLTDGLLVFTSNAFTNPAFQAQTLSEVLPATGHSPALVPSVASVGGQAGLRGGVVCGLCGQALQENRPVSPQKVLSIPAATRVIEAEAFAGIGAEQVTIPYGVVSIGDGAFAACDSLLLAVIPETVTTIEGNPFSDSDVAVICPDGSPAALWCDSHGIPHNP